MKKKVFATLLAVSMIASMVPAAVSVQAADGDSIRLVNGKIEVDAQLKKLAEMYEKETGTKVEIESMGGGIDIQGTLKGYYQSDNMPDIFVNGSGADFANWTDMLVDMSDQDWASDTDAAYVDESQGTIGFPYTTEAIGLAYNKDILDKAGIDPSTLTGPDAIKEAFETIDSKKDELGLTAVVGYAAEPVNLYWSTGNHLFGNYLDSGLDRDDTTYIDMLNDGGKVDEDRLTDFANFVGLLNQYSDPALLVSGTYDQQILNFSSGKYAFVTQGSWIGATMTGDDADAYKEAGFVSPFKSCTIVGDDPFAQTITDYVSAGKTSAWHWLEQKEGLAQNYTGQVFADYASGSLDEAGFVKTLEQVIQSAYAN